MIGIMIIGPIIIIAVVTSAFENIMKSYEGADKFTVGYSLEDDSVFSDYMEAVKEAAGENGIGFTEFSSNNVEEIVRKNTISCFVDFSKDTYTIYKMDEYVTEGMTTEYLLTKIVKQLSFSSQENRLTTLDFQTLSIDVPAVQIKSVPPIESKDYYGIIYIIFFIWSSFVCLSSVLASEMNNGIEKKFAVTSVSNFGLYMAKAIPCLLATICEMSITVVFVTLLYQIKWGNIPTTILILLLAMVTATTFGLFLFYLLRNLAVTVVVNFLLVWVAGFFGGSFETYMFASWSESIKRISPILIGRCWNIRVWEVVRIQKAAYNI
jgi:ABC-2 type transport system permease protein